MSLYVWLLIDGEHRTDDLHTMLAALQAIAPYPVHPVVHELASNFRRGG